MAPARADALLLAAGELAGAAGEQMADAEDLHCAVEPALPFWLRHAARLEAEHDVLGNVEMREQA